MGDLDVLSRRCRAKDLSGVAQKKDTNIMPSWATVCKSEGLFQTYVLRVALDASGHNQNLSEEVLKHIQSPDVYAG